MLPAPRVLFLITVIVSACSGGSAPSLKASSAPPPLSPTTITSQPPHTAAAIRSPSPATNPAADQTETAYLMTGLRHDIAPRSCTNKPEGLPPGAVAGIECKLATPPAARVGVYLFRDVNSLRAAYLAKLADYGVVKSGVQPSTDQGCAEGVPSDRTYASSPTGGLPGRVGCFRNEQGYANIRVIWPESLVYVGVLGTDGDIARLFKWSWQGQSPSDPGLAIWQPPDPNPLQNLYAALRPEDLAATDGRVAFTAGEEIRFTYKLVNRGSTEQVVPLIDFYGDLFYLVGSEQAWVQRLGEDSSIPCLSASLIDEEGRYAAGGQILAFPGPPGPSIAPGDGLLRNDLLDDTSCFAAGRYRYFVEYRRLAEDDTIKPGVFGGTVLRSVSVEFAIEDQTSP